MFTLLPGDGSLVFGKILDVCLIHDSFASGEWSISFRGIVQLLGGDCVFPRTIIYAYDGSIYMLPLHPSTGKGLRCIATLFAPDNGLVIAGQWSICFRGMFHLFAGIGVFVSGKGCIRFRPWLICFWTMANCIYLGTDPFVFGQW